MTNPLRAMVEQTKVAARQAADSMRNLIGVSRDQDLRLYNRLTPDDFAEIAATYGENALHEYIRYFETKRLQGG